MLVPAPRSRCYHCNRPDQIKLLQLILSTGCLISQLSAVSAVNVYLLTGGCGAAESSSAY